MGGDTDTETVDWKVLLFAENQISFTCYLKRGRLDANEEILYEPVHFIGNFSECALALHNHPRINITTL